MAAFEDILKDLRNKKFAPIYFLMGEEAYFIDQISDYIEKNALTPEEKEFNQLVMYGSDTDAASVINAAKRFPMMAQKQVVIVKEAQNLKKIEDLVYYVEQPSASTILVVSYKYKKLDKRMRLSKLLAKNAILFESKKIYDNQVPAWISDYLKKRSVAIDQKAAMLLTEFLGNDLSKVANELDKLMLTLPEGAKKVTPELVERNIGISKDFNNFELQKALAEGDVLKANRIVDYFDKNQRMHPLQATLPVVFNFYRNLMIYHYLPNKDQRAVAAGLGINPYFVKDYQQAARRYGARKVMSIVSDIREYDAKSKGFGNVSTTSGDLLKELVYKILH